VKLAVENYQRTIPAQGLNENYGCSGLASKCIAALVFGDYRNFKRHMNNAFRMNIPKSQFMKLLNLKK